MTCLCLALRLTSVADIKRWQQAVLGINPFAAGGCQCDMCRDDRRMAEAGPDAVGRDFLNRMAGRYIKEPAAAVPARATQKDIDEAIKLALEMGKINQAMFDAYKLLPGDSLRYNYAKSQPWMGTLIDFAASKGFKYAGGGYFSVVFTKGELAIKMGTKGEDSGAAYAAWARDNAGLAGVPVIHHIERYGRQSYTVVMPRYAEVKNYEQARAVKEGRMGEVSETYKKIAAFFKGVAEMDLHGDNIMRDPVTGTIIITDPVSFKAGSRP